MKKLLTLLLTAALLLPSAAGLTGCSSGGSDSTNTDAPSADAGTVSQGEPSAEPEPEETAGRVAADLPERDFGGAEMNFYGRIYSGAWSAIDIAVHEQNGEHINDALFERTVYIEDTYNVVLTPVESGDSGITNAVQNAVKAGDTSWQAAVGDVYDSGSLASSGALLDLTQVENLDLSARWWTQMLNGSLSIGHKLYYATGDIFIIDNKATRVFFFNKDLVRNVGLEDPYTLVRENRWTVETYAAMNEAVKSDLDGDGIMNRKYDRFGTMAQPTLGCVLYFASGNLLAGKNADDIPELTCMTPEAIDVMTGIASHIGGSEAISLSGETTVNGSYPDNLVYFQEGRVLFAPEVLLHIETMRDCEVDIGILPAPKYTESQDKFYCYADGWCVNVASIPVTNPAPGDIAFIMEAMAADSLNNLTPAYYEICLTEKYVRDPESVEMLDLILSSVVMDNANIFSWGGVEDTVASSIYAGEGIASSLESKRKAAEKIMGKTIKAFIGE